MAWPAGRTDVRTTPAATDCRNVRRSIISIPCLHTLFQVIRSSPRHRQDRPGGVLRAAADERRSVGDVDVLRVVQSAEAIGHRGSRVVAHPRRTNLVNRPAGRQRLALDLDVLGLRGHQHFLDRVRHVLRHLQLVVAEDVVELEHRNPPRVLHDRIERDAVLLARQDLAEPAEADERRIVLPHVRLERLAVSRNVVCHAGILASSRRRPGSGSRG